MPETKKTVSILGSTGSIGCQSLDVIDRIENTFGIGYLTANRNIRLLEEQALKFNPVGVAIGDEALCREFKKTTSFKGEVLSGVEGVLQAAAYESNDLVLSALVGFSGVLPTLEAIKQGTTIALANKETLVSAGSIITREALLNNVDIIAVDSEHSAILQCLAGESDKEVEKIILTASGGPFLDTPVESFGRLTVKDALNHPNWSMGDKITIDSATMMNKGFEVIEAYWLFSQPREKIDVLIHPQSIVHSMVQFVDGSVKAQLGLPDMRIPISYALTYPSRMKMDFPRLDLADLTDLSFRRPDLGRTPCLRLAFESLDMGGNAPTIINAANEVAVRAFLNESITFDQIPSIIEKALEKISHSIDPSLDDIVLTDRQTRIFAESIIH